MGSSILFNDGRRARGGARTAITFQVAGSPRAGGCWRCRAIRLASGCGEGARRPPPRTDALARGV
jgi:hypothetical protein